MEGILDVTLITRVKSKHVQLIDKDNGGGVSFQSIETNEYANEVQSNPSKKKFKSCSSCKLFLSRCLVVVFCGFFSSPSYCYERF